MTNCHNAVIVYANNYQFNKDEIILHSQVQSRMLLWCKSGKGIIEINKKKFAFEKDEFLFLPWNRRIRYIPSPQDPFYVAGIHIIPDYKKNQSIQFNVSHHKSDSIANDTNAKDKFISELDGTLSGTFKYSQELFLLSEYLVRAFQREPPNEKEMRNYAKILLTELIRYFSSSEKQSNITSNELGRIIQFIHNHIDKPLSLIDLEKFSVLSSGAICRLFKNHLNTTPCKKIAEIKMKRAKQLITNGRISMSEVGSKIGIVDPYYFSKRFKKVCGLSPLEYRKQNTFL